MTPRIRLSPTPARTAVIVSDDLGFVGMLRERLRQAGCRPIWARNAREAVVAITDERPAIVVIDVGVPRVRGLELLAKLDRSPVLARIPRLVLSSSDQDLRGRIKCFQAPDLVRIAERVGDDPRLAE